MCWTIRNAPGTARSTGRSPTCWTRSGCRPWSGCAATTNGGKRNWPLTSRKPTRIRRGGASRRRSETPEGVLQEVYALSLGHYVTRAVKAQAAAAEGLDPDRLSFVGALRILRYRLPECAGIEGAGVGAVVRGVGVGGGAGTQPAAPQPDQPARGQAEDVEVGQSVRMHCSTSVDENLSGDSSYYLAERYWG